LPCGGAKDHEFVWASRKERDRVFLERKNSGNNLHGRASCPPYVLRCLFNRRTADTTYPPQAIFQSGQTSTEQKTILRKSAQSVSSVFYSDVD